MQTLILPGSAAGQRILQTLRAAHPLSCSGLLLENVADVTQVDIEALVSTGAISPAPGGCYRLNEANHAQT